MDLQTVMRKVKTFAYSSKKEFVADLELIWFNCLQYNTQHESIYRRHAYQMRKKTLELVKKIPDYDEITSASHMSTEVLTDEKVGAEYIEDKVAIVKHENSNESEVVDMVNTNFNAQNNRSLEIF